MAVDGPRQTIQPGFSVPGMGLSRFGGNPAFG